jgi:hypothetical protein
MKANLRLYQEESWPVLYLFIINEVQGSILLFIINYMLLNMDGPIADHVSCDQSYMGIMGPEYLRQTMLYSIIRHCRCGDIVTITMFGELMLDF